MQKINPSFFCANCKHWVRQPIDFPEPRKATRVHVVCPDCGAVIHSSELEIPKPGSQQPQKLFRVRCTNPSCGQQIEAMLPPHSVTPIPCQGCGQTALIGSVSEASGLDPSGAGNLFGALGTTVVTQQFGCPSCGHRWEQTFEAVYGAVHRVLCPNQECPTPALLDYVIEGIDAPQASTTDRKASPRPTKPRPNDQCPCGSGKKFKKCCGKHR